MEIRKVMTEEELFKVGRLRYDIAINEEGVNKIHMDHINKTVIEPLDHCGHIFAAWDQGKLVGTFRINLIRECNEVDFDFITENLPENITPWSLSVTTRLVIAKSYRKSTLAIKFAIVAYQFGLENEVTHDAIYCYQPLVSKFKRLSYSIHRDKVHHPDYGNVTVMFLELKDDISLKVDRPPFYRILKSFLDPQLFHVSAS